MTIKKRWIAGIVATAAKCDKPMPWTRSAPRQAMIAARKAQSKVLKRA